MATEKTAQEYRKLAAHFYEQRLGGEQPTPKKITDALKQAASDYRPAYWRRLRGALAFDQGEKGFDRAAERIQGTRNPLTTGRDGEALDKSQRGAVPPKQRRAKSISAEDWAVLWAGAVGMEDGGETCAALLLAKHLGVRPAEMPGLQVDQERGVVHVTGAKRTGQRGADRELMLDADRDQVVMAVGIIQRAEADQPGAMRRIQSRLDRLSRKLWPRRQARPSLYTFRHQMGSELKSMKLNRRAIAYVMGHQSTQSVEVYGDRRKSRGGIGIKLTGQEASRFQGRENHTAAPLGITNAHLPAMFRQEPAQPAQPEASEGRGRSLTGRPRQRPQKGPGGPGM